MEIYLIFVDAAQNSNKFWSAKVEQSNLTVKWGRVGYKSQQKVHSFGNAQQAVSKFHNLVAEKKMKGYRESQPQIDSTSDSLEMENDDTPANDNLSSEREYSCLVEFETRYAGLFLRTAVG